MSRYVTVCPCPTWYFSWFYWHFHDLNLINNICLCMWHFVHGLPDVFHDFIVISKSMKLRKSSRIISLWINLNLLLQHHVLFFQIKKRNHWCLLGKFSLINRDRDMFPSISKIEYDGWLSRSRPRGSGKTGVETLRSTTKIKTEIKRCKTRDSNN